jgi:prepilin-type N-terminal cleavage/methylation domain-containing protein
MKKKGFTLIELVVVVAIILLLAATLAPKLRKEVSKARDAKAVAALGAVRTASGVFIADNGTVPYLKESVADKGDGLIENGTTDSDYLENSVVSFLGTLAGSALTAELPSGASTAVSGTIAAGEYGADVTLSGDSEGDYVFNETTFDTKGNAWASY